MGSPIKMQVHMLITSFTKTMLKKQAVHRIKNH